MPTQIIGSPILHPVKDRQRFRLAPELVISLMTTRTVNLWLRVWLIQSTQTLAKRPTACLLEQLPEALLQISYLATRTLANHFQHGLFEKCAYGIDQFCAKLHFGLLVRLSILSKSSNLTGGYSFFKPPTTF
jgi:hypothetical protein